MKRRIRLIFVGGAVLALASCQSVQNHFDKSMEYATPDTAVEEVTVTPAVVMGEPEIRVLKSDNARLQRQLAGALKENAKLKRDLAELKDDNSLLKDLASKKQR
jgi:hypothetical protein